jgi:ribose 5-phosphate isomerase RpiB
VRDGVGRVVLRGVVTGLVVGALWAAGAVLVLLVPSAIAEGDIALLPLIPLVALAYAARPALIGMAICGGIGAGIGAMMWAVSGHGVRVTQLVGAATAVVVALVLAPRWITRGFSPTFSEGVDDALELFAATGLPALLGGYAAWRVGRQITARPAYQPQTTRRRRR